MEKIIFRVHVRGFFHVGPYTAGHCDAFQMEKVSGIPHTEAYGRPSPWTDGIPMGAFSEFQQKIDDKNSTMLFGFSSISKMLSWFRECEMIFLHEKEFIFSSVSVDSADCLEAVSQVMFDKEAATILQEFSLKDIHLRKKSGKKPLKSVSPVFVGAKRTNLRVPESLSVVQGEKDPLGSYIRIKFLKRKSLIRKKI